jgi:splicing factor 3B subunit 3
MAPNATAATGAGVTDDDAPAVPTHSIAMKLLDVRLQPATAILTSVTGEFTDVGRHEIAALKAGGMIEIYRIVTVVTEDADGEDDASNATSKTVIKLILRVETRSVLRSCAVVRFPGEKRDVLAVTADSGALSILDFLNSTCKILHCAVFGKTACRRATPGQYVASDPKGRAVLVAATEKRKLVYVLNNRSAENAATSLVASPLEAHRARTITFDVVGIDNGYDNPIFAALELQYPEQEDAAATTWTASAVEKQLAYYELDLGLNHVSRRWATTTHRSACCLAALPGGADGPGGVLVGGEDWVEYVHEAASTSSNHIRNLACSIPRRELHPSDKGILITSIVVHRQKKSKFFALAQSELGDVYKIIVQLNEPDKTKVVGMEIALLDTLPNVNALNVSKLGMLFAAASFGDHHLYQFERIDLPDAPKNTSDEATKALTASGSTVLTTALASEIASKFVPTVLQNLRKIHSLDNPSPTTGVLVGELAGNEVSPQIYALTGSGPTSALRVTRHGASVTELAVSELPGVPGAIFTIGTGNTAGGKKLDQFIVVSFADATLVLSVGETVEEVGKESGFLTNSPTLACSALGSDGALCQVHPVGVRHIQNGQAKQWHCPGLKRIECASANESQVIVALAGGEIIYFELDPMSGNLMESATREMGADVCCLDVGTIPKGRSRSLFAVVGCRDQTVRVISLEPDKTKILSQRSSTALKARPHSVALQMMNAGVANSNANVDDLTLIIGLDDGSSLRASIDPITGSIGTSPTRRFLGARPVAVSRISLESNPATLLLSSRPWITRRDAASGKHIMAPLSYAPLDHGCSFSSDAVSEGIVATAGKTLRILSIESSGMEGGDDEAFNTNKIPLRYTPRQMTLMSATPSNAQERKVVLVVVESDCNEYGFDEKKSMGFDPSGEGKGEKTGGKEDDAMDVDSDDEGRKEDLNQGDDEDDEEEKAMRRTSIRGPVPSSPGHWGSCVRLLDPSNSCTTLDCIEMGRNEAALCCASVRFHSKGGEPLLAVGTVTGMTMHPLKQDSSHIVIYRIVNGDRFQLLHRTSVDDGPVLSLAHFQGRLLVGIGTTLRLYEMGKRQLLRKSELRNFPTFVKTVQTVGERAYIGDMMQSIQIVRYDVSANRLVLIANDASPRPIVCQELLDWNTVAVGDKFGNISVMRLPRGADTSAIDVTGQRALWDSSREDMIPKLELLCQYYVGEVVTSMTRSSLVAGGAESLIYVTVSGRIGAFVPFTNRNDVDFYSQLESELRGDASRPTGRDPQSYRSYYAPIMHVVDGDLCDAFNSLGPEKQNKIAEKLDRTVGEIMKKLEDTRNALL